MASVRIEVVADGKRGTVELGDTETGHPSSFSDASVAEMLLDNAVRQVRVWLRDYGSQLRTPVSELESAREPVTRLKHTYTSHGHACCDDPESDAIPPVLVAGCGGPRTCRECRSEVDVIHGWKEGPRDE